MITMDDFGMALMAGEVRRVPKGKSEFESIKGRGEVILAIEDEEMLRDFLRTILEENGYKVLLAADGTEGLQTYREHMNGIDLVLLDMGLPRMSGEEVLSGIVSSSPNAKVISVSGSVEPEVQASALQIGAVDYLPKPYLTGELLAKVHNILHGGHPLTR